MADGNGQPISIGSGFFVAADVIATNAHVVDGAASGRAKRLSDESAMTIDGMVGLDATRDIALLKVSGTGPPLALGDSATLEIGETVYAIGNPQGFEGTFSQGIVSGVRSVAGDRFLQITAPISPGSSGGPVLNARGEVVGVATATFRGGQNLNFAMPIEYVKTLLNTENPVTQLRGNRSLARRALQAEIGKPATAGVVGENFQWDGVYDFEGGGFTLTLRNQLDRPIHNVYALVIFHDRQGRPVETTAVSLHSTIPAGLARRVAGQVDASLKRIVSSSIRSGTAYSLTPVTKLVIRVLRFEFADS